MIYKLGELFCGPGGIAWGALNAQIKNPDFKIEHAWANDIDEDTCKTYIRNICPGDPDSVYCKDVRELDFNVLEPVNALAFGFPCNDFSNVGKRRGAAGEYGGLYQYAIKALKHFQPDWFLAENVSGLKSADQGSTFNLILQEMEDEGYNLYPNLYKFETYGVPQIRHRLIIVGIKKDKDPGFKVPSNLPYENIDNSCKKALENPPIKNDAPNHERTNHTSTVVERLKYIKPGENAFTADLPEDLKLNVKGVWISQIYKRLEPEKPAYTVTGSGGGGTHIYHWSEPRALTNRERARLQTFPDDFVFEGGKGSVRKQIGMAVPCKGAQIIFEAILNTLAEIDYEGMPLSIKG